MIQIVTGSQKQFSLDSAILELLPAQGSVELQRDEPGKIHHFHTHPVDEILVIIHGTLNFAWDGGEKICGPGDKIMLPAGTVHQSEALKDGAVYVIATRPPAAN